MIEKHINNSSYLEKEIQLNTLQAIQEYNLDSLKTINKLKSSNYDELMSKICINFDLREDCLSNNDLNENNITILTNLYNKLNGKSNGKEKKKKGNKPNKDGMGLLLSLDVSEAALLYQSYKNNNQNNIKYFESYLYSIKIDTPNEDNVNKYIGFIFPINLGESFKIKLINRKKGQINYAEIKKEKKVELTYEQMKHIITYHYSICNQLLRGKKNLENELIQSYMKNLSKNDIYKKYFFVPLNYNENQIDIEEN